MQVASYREMEPARFRRGQGWKVNLFGRNSDVPTPDPQAFRIDMNTGMILPVHLHIVNQFQIFIAGSGKIGREQAEMISAHYADHHTAYGPLVAGDHGMSYLTLRPHTDAGMVKLGDPGLRARMKPSKRRQRLSRRVTLAIPPVLRHRTQPVIETIMEEKPGDEGMTVQVMRLGAGIAARAPGTTGNGGYYVIVMNGSLVHESQTLAPWSLSFVRPGEEPPMLQAGEEGLEAMIAVFPIEDGWMREVGAS